MIENLTVSIIGELDKQSKSQLIDLWNHEYPVKLCFANMLEFDDYLKGLKDLTHLVFVDKQNAIQAWSFLFERENETWFSILISNKSQGKGLGREILDLLKQTETQLNGWVIDHDTDRKQNGEIYYSPLDFYKKCGFEVIKSVRLELDKISAVKIRWSRI